MHQLLLHPLKPCLLQQLQHHHPLTPLPLVLVLVLVSGQ
jgi:hypothetical protein